MGYIIDGATGALTSGQSGSQLVRTSTGNLYAVTITSGDIRVYKSTDNGITWGQKDSLNSPPAPPGLAALAIDGTDNLHIAYAFSTTVGRYISFSTSTDTFGRSENVVVQAATIQTVAIAVDSNNIPHAVWGASGTPSLSYSNRLAGRWKPTVNVLKSATSADIQIGYNNVPLISYVNNTDGAVTVLLGNKNNAGAFTATNVSTAMTVGGGTSITIDVSNNVWLAYQGASDGRIQLAKHVATDAWATWQTAVTDGFNGKSVSLAADIYDIYIFYERNAGGLAYDRYDTVNGRWLGEQIIQPVTSTMTTNFRPHNPFVKWSQYFNNGDTGANNAGQSTIEYLFDDGATVYYDKLVTAQISTGLVNFSFSSAAGATTTSTSSTSSSTSISTSSTSSSTSASTSISTSSTSQSTSISTSTSSTSRSTSTSSTSTSFSTSSTSSSISTSSTSSSISTSSTSSSISTSISTSSTSSSISTSISTSSTSTSISTSSTSSSISTSSTSASTSTSQSTSTSSTSSSTSRSTSTSSTSQSTSTSSTSTSFSTSSTSSSTSTSSTSSSISTSSTSSSTSQSTSTSISSTSSSTSTTQSFTTSTSSTSASTSISTSTSSTSQSTSISTSSTSKSTSTSSTSASTSISTSSTSSSTSKSTSTSSTSQSTSASTSVSTSTSSTSQSTSTSTTTAPATTTSTSSTSVSTSSTSSSTSTSTTAIDVNMIPRAIIRPFRIWARARTTRPVVR